MDVASPIRSVIPSLDGPVLSSLAATAIPLTLADVHRVAGVGSRSGVLRVLRRLEDHGIVLAVPGGFVLNREHVAAGPIEQLAALHGDLATRVRAATLRWNPPPLLVGLFGSAARRDGDAASDIDVLIVSDADDLESMIAELAAHIRSWTGNDAQVLGINQRRLRRMQRNREPIVNDWQVDLIALAGDREILAPQRAR